MGEIRQLRDDIIPVSLHQSHEETQNWHVTFDPESLHMMKSIPNDWNMEIDVSRPEGASTSGVEPARRLAELSGKMWALEEGLGVINALCEQARVILDNLDRLDNMFGDVLKIPTWSEGLVGVLDLISGFSTCMIDAKGESMMMMLCPMRYATAASYVMRELTNLKNKFFGGGGTGTTTIFPVVTGAITPVPTFNPFR